MIFKLIAENQGCFTDKSLRTWGKGKERQIPTGKLGCIVSWCVGHLVGLSEAPPTGSGIKGGAVTAYRFSAGMEVHRCF